MTALQQNPRRVPAAERRAMILAAARGLFARQGYHGTSVGDIARDSGCAEALLYRHFPSKQELLAAVLDDGGRTVRAEIEQALAAAGDDPFGALLGSLGRRRSAVDMEDALRVRSLAASMVHEPEIRESLEAHVTAFRGLVAAAALTSQRNGHLRDDVGHEQIASLVGGISFLAAFELALKGSGALEAMAPAADALLTVLRPVGP